MRNNKSQDIFIEYLEIWLAEKGLKVENVIISDPKDMFDTKQLGDQL